MFWLGLFIGVIVGIFVAGLGKAAKEDSINENGEYVCNYDSDQPDGVFKPKKED
jgi:hypothetical protein